SRFVVRHITQLRREGNSTLSRPMQNHLDSEPRQSPVSSLLPSPAASWKEPGGCPTTCLAEPSTLHGKARRQSRERRTMPATEASPGSAPPRPTPKQPVSSSFDTGSHRGEHKPRAVVPASNSGAAAFSNPSLARLSLELRAIGNQESFM